MIKYTECGKMLPYTVLLEVIQAFSFHVDSQTKQMDADTRMIEPLVSTHTQAKRQELELMNRVKDQLVTENMNKRLAEKLFTQSEIMMIMRLTTVVLKYCDWYDANHKTAPNTMTSMPDPYPDRDGLYAVEYSLAKFYLREVLMRSTVFTPYIQVFGGQYIIGPGCEQPVMAGKYVYDHLKAVATDENRLSIERQYAERMLATLREEPESLNNHIQELPVLSVQTEIDIREKLMDAYNRDQLSIYFDVYKLPYALTDILLGNRHL